jgi:hypothetical protein
MGRVNRLASATSPYLQQHKGNPVDWWEWSDEALAEAKRRDVPILLSVGYAACHWCHVMAHDSFEDEPTAALMNEHYVNIKVDREERPDIDAVYMEATTALTGQGGWPMTCLLTPDGQPFFAGTFFPRTQFQQLLRSVAQAWAGDRAEVLAAGQRVIEALAEVALPRFDADEVPTGDHLTAAAATLVAQADAQHGGFGRAPKFPPSMAIEFLLREHERTGGDASLAVVAHTLEAMARGGIYDQLAGGFARYSVDGAWVVPHFEKMLYDNALLLRGYLHWWRLTGAELGERIARETADFLLRDLGTPEGGFASALDADTDGVEGLTYVWTPQQLHAVLGDDADAAAKLLVVTAAGTFEDGASTLQLPHDPDQRWRDWQSRLLTARRARPQPARDDKVVAAWNGLAIGALAEAGVLLDDPRHLAAARRCAELVLRVHFAGGRLRRTSRDGVAGAAAGVAEDYGDLADGLLLLHQATGELAWLHAAGELLDTALDRFGDGAGGFFDTADDAETTGAASARDLRQRGAVRVERAGHGIAQLFGLDRFAGAPRRRVGRAARGDRVRRAPAALPRLGIGCRGGDGVRPGAGRDRRGAAERTAVCHCLAAASARRGGGECCPAGRRDRLVVRPRPGRRCAGGLRVPRHGLRPAGHLGRGVGRGTRALELGALLAQLVDLGHRLAQAAQPVFGVLADEAHAPGERVGARAGYAGVDEGVEHLTFALAQPRHDRHREVGEQHPGIADAGAPGDLAPVARLRLGRDLHPLLAGLFAESADPAQRSGVCGIRSLRRG